MCNIAGYAGSRRAAPILIEMMRREEFIDGGQSTGIATIHEGKLYTAKVLGDVEELLRSTDAASFPGTVGIIHSRPSGNLASHAHPFTSEDGKLAIVLNGTLRDVATPEFFARSNELMQGFFDRGFTVKSAYERSSDKRPCRMLRNGLGYHDSEIYAQLIGDAVSGTPKEQMAEAMLTETARAIDELPADIVVLGIHADLDGTVTVGDVTRPMVVGFGDGETYLATTALAFPDDVRDRSVLPLPPASISQITKDGVRVSSKKLENVRVEQIGYRTASIIYDRLEKLLKGKSDAPLSLYDMPVYEEWRDLWSEPYVDCKYATETGLLKPYAAVLYETLWAFYKEGRLHSTLGERKGHPITRFWID